MNLKKSENENVSYDEKIEYQGNLITIQLSYLAVYLFIHTEKPTALRI